MLWWDGEKVGFRLAWDQPLQLIRKFNANPPFSHLPNTLPYLHQGQPGHPSLPCLLPDVLPAVFPPWEDVLALSSVHHCSGRPSSIPQHHSAKSTPFHHNLYIPHREEARASRLALPLDPSTAFLEAGNILETDSRCCLTATYCLPSRWHPTHQAFYPFFYLLSMYCILLLIVRLHTETKAHPLIHNIMKLSLYADCFLGYIRDCLGILCPLSGHSPQPLWLPLPQQSLNNTPPGLPSSIAKAPSLQAPLLEAAEQSPSPALVTPISGPSALHPSVTLKVNILSPDGVQCLSVPHSTWADPSVGPVFPDELADLGAFDHTVDSLAERKCPLPFGAEVETIQSRPPTRVVPGEIGSVI